MNELSGQLLEDIDCPLCGGRQMDIIRPPRYPNRMTVEEWKKMYSASSDHALMDQVVRCRTCSLHYLNPRPKADLIIGGYAEAEDVTFVAQNDQRLATSRRAIHRMLRHLGKTSGEEFRLLDVGCAGGAFPAAAREAGFSVVGVEPCRWLADFGRRTYGLDIRDGLLQPGMFPSASFDVITLWDVIEHVPDPHELLTLIRDLLRTDGLLLINYPDIGSVAARVLGSRWPFWLSVHLLYYTRKTMARQLARAGFTVREYHPFWQTLQLGYVLQRAASHLRPLGVLPPFLKALRLSGLPCTYNMGQTLVIARNGIGQNQENGQAG